MGVAVNIIFEQQWPVVYLKVALRLLNLTSLSSLSVPINIFPLRHSWNSSHIDSFQQLPLFHQSLSVTICYYSPITECFCQSWTSEQVNICSNTKLKLIEIHFPPWCLCVRVGLSVHCCVNTMEVNNKCHNALLYNNIPFANWYWENEKKIQIYIYTNPLTHPHTYITSEQKMHQELFVTCIAKFEMVSNGTRLFQNNKNTTQYLKKEKKHCF